MTSIVLGRSAATPTRWLVGIALVSVLAAVTIQSAPVVAFLVPASALALAAARLEPAMWVGAALALTWFSRLLTETGVVPRPFAFLDFALIPAALGAALLSSRTTGDTLSPLARRIVRWSLVAALAIAASWIANPSEPQRLLAAVAIVLEPVLAIIVLLVAPPTRVARARLERLVVVIGLTQIPVALLQASRGVDADNVRGTLTGAGAGAHVMAGGLFLVALFILARRSHVVGGIAIVVAVFVATLADAKQILFLAPVAIAGLAVTGVRSAHRGRQNRLVGRLLLVVIAAASVALVTSYRATSTGAGIVERTVSTRGGKVRVAGDVVHAVTSSPFHALFGLGPGESVSRFAFLTTPGLLKEGSPVSALGLHEARYAADFNEVARRDLYRVGGSSATGAQSSLLGLVGDYGAFGLAALCGVIAVVARALRRRRTPLANVALVGWLLVVALALISDWLEQPPFTLLLATITGLALTEPSACSISPASLVDTNEAISTAAK